VQIPNSPENLSREDHRKNTVITWALVCSMGISLSIFALQLLDLNESVLLAFLFINFGIVMLLCTTLYKNLKSTVLSGTQKLKLENLPSSRKDLGARITVGVFFCLMGVGFIVLAGLIWEDLRSGILSVAYAVMGTIYLVVGPLLSILNQQRGSLDQ